MSTEEQLEEVQQNAENQNLQNYNEQKSRNESKKARNDANNAKTAQVAADIASKSANPYAKAAGMAVKGIDKVTGGKASQAIGKGLTKANKLTPGGNIIQGLSNKMNESGTTDRLASAMNKKNAAGTAGAKGNGTLSHTTQSASTSEQTRENIEETSPTSMENASISYQKVVKIALMLTPVFVIVIFCNLFISSSQIYINSIGFGNADSLSYDDVDTKIEENESKWDDEITDEEYLESAYIYRKDIFIQDDKSLQKYIQVRESLISKYNIATGNKVTVNREDREGNEADLSELKDFYGNYLNSGENIDMDVVYTFFYKMHYLYCFYRDTYGVHLDLPLLMATLNVQSTEKAVIFKSNIIGYDDKQLELKSNNNRFDYEKVHNYKSSPVNSQYDMEVLAQHMVSIQATERCIDSTGKATKENILRDDEIETQVLKCDIGETYEVSKPVIKEDSEKYKEFLPEFLETKYYINKNETTIDSHNPNYTDGVTFIDGGFGSNVYYYNQKDYQDYYFTSDPYNTPGDRTSFCSLGKGNCRQTIASSGCGPTSLSIAVSTLLGEPHDPIEMTSRVCSNGGCAPGGTGGWSFSPTAAEYGLKVENTGSAQKVSNALADGNSIVIALMGPGNFTSGGHYITLTGVNSNGEVYVADCFREYNNGWWSLSTIVEQLSGNSNFWIVSR